MSGLSSEADDRSSSSEVLLLYLPVESEFVGPLAASNTSLFFACTCASRSAFEPSARCLSELPDGPHSSGPGKLENSPFIPSLDRLRLGEAAALALPFEILASLPSKLEAMPCNDDHDVSHKPVENRDGAACEGPVSELPSIPLVCCNLCGGLRIDEVEREGWVDGMGEAALERRDEDVVDCCEVIFGDDPLSSVSNPSSREIRRLFRGRRVADVPAFWGWEFMADAAHLAESI